MRSSSGLVRWLGLVGMVAMIGCGEGAPGAGDDDDDDGAGVDAGESGVDGGDGDRWETLIGGDWTVPSGDETYRCVRLTVQETMYISEFRAVAPEGTHHTVLTVGDPSGPDGIESCSAGTNADGMIYGSGVGTNPIAFPPGVAMKVEAGQQLLLNLHLFNVSGAELQGYSGTEVVTLTESEVEQEAEVILAGPVDLSIPPGEHDEVGQCTMNGDVTIFAVGPHMHQLGVHMKVVAEAASGDIVLHDAPYDFYEQRVYLQEPMVELSQGERVVITCSYNNTTPSTVTFGDSSEQEMCFAGLYRFPAHGAQFNIGCVF